MRRYYKMVQNTKIFLVFWVPHSNPSDMDIPFSKASLDIFFPLFTTGKKIHHIIFLSRKNSFTVIYYYYCFSHLGYLSSSGNTLLKFLSTYSIITVLPFNRGSSSCVSKYSKVSCKVSNSPVLRLINRNF